MATKKLPTKSEKLNGIGIFLKKQFGETEKQRKIYREDEWLENLRQFKGIYDPEIEQKIVAGKSRVYPRYTRSKVQPAIAKLNDMVFPNNGQNWEIKHTPEPKLSEKQLDEIIASMELLDEEGNAREVTEDDVAKAVEDFAKVRAEKMTVTMADQLTELKYPIKGKSMIRSAVMLGTGILKGPLATSKTKRQVVKEGDKYIQKEKKVFMPFVDSISLWRSFPDMSSTELEHCNFFYELHSMTKHELRKLAKKKPFKSDIIKEYLRSHKDGDYKLRQWEIDLKTIKDEENVSKEANKYEVLECNTYLDGHDLMEAGILREEDDPNKDWFVNVWLLGDKVIKLTVYPDPIKSLTDLYHIFYFEKDESSIFGEGLPRIIRHTQMSLASALRAMLDNAAWVAGPIFEMNVDLMPDEDTDDVHPGRAFDREGRGADAQSQAIRAHNISSHIPDYLALMDKLERLGDMESTMPAFLFGAAAKTTNETSKGISIRQSNTNLTINDIVRNFDEANESFLRSLYAWNMEFNPDKSIKGDMQVKAISSSSLVTKEVRTQAMDNFSQSLSPTDQPYVKTREMLVERIKLHDLDPDKILHTEEEAQANIASARDSELIQLEKNMLIAETRYEHGKALNMETKSKATLQGITDKELETAAKVIQAIKGGRSGEGGESRTTGEG